MRLIDADELKKQQTYLWDEVMGHVPCVLLYDIDKAPTIDAVPVVRCKDCAVSYCLGDDDFVVCSRGGINVDPDNFCSYGERRSDD